MDFSVLLLDNLLLELLQLESLYQLSSSYPLVSSATGLEISKSSFTSGSIDSLL